MNVYIDHCIMWVFYHLISEIEARACIETWRVQIFCLNPNHYDPLFPRSIKTRQTYTLKQLFYAININNRLAKPNKG